MRFAITRLGILGPVVCAGLLAACMTDDKELNNAFDGYWKNTKADADYDSYMKIKDGKGFQCVMDQKSSFFFEVHGDKRTTPMNGRESIYFADTTKSHVVIEGQEKGQ